MFVVDCYGHNFSNGVLFAYHNVVDVPGGSSNLGYRRRVPLGHNPPTRVLRELDNMKESVLTSSSRKQR